MMIFKKAIPRRTFLRGAGTALALPLLEGMIPAFASKAETTAASALRLSFVYAPNGMIMNEWTPTNLGTAFDLPRILQPLAPFRDHFLVLSGLNHNEMPPRAEDRDKDAAPHERAGVTFLTGIHPTREGPYGISVDQIAAKELGKKTQLASLELGLHDNDVVGQCEKGWSCGVLRTLSWRTPTTPLPIENQPRAVFERLFGDNQTTDARKRLARVQQDRSLLDSISEAASSLLNKVGPGDGAKISDYLDAIRDIERRIQMAEEQSSRELPTVARPVGVPDRFDDHAKLMFDLNVLAYQCDLTRVSTFMMGREQSDRSFREIDIPDAHHALTHHSGDPDKIAKVVQINIFHSLLFAYFLEKLRTTADGNGSLLDHTMIVYGSGISNGMEHDFRNLPILVAGGGAGVKGGRHFRYPKDTPMTNLYLTLLDKLGIPMEKFGDSNGKLDLLPVA